MQASKSFRQIFYKKLLLGLKFSVVSTENQSFWERKRIIKLAADTALAFAAGGAVWSRALIRNISKLDNDKMLLRNMLGKEFESLTKPSQTVPVGKILGSTRVLKSYIKLRRNKKKGCKRPLARTVATSLVKKRTQMLKCLIPGGETMDKCCLLRETADYILSLKTQVDVMRSVVKALQISSYHVSENRTRPNE